MDESVGVDELLAQLLDISHPLAAIDMPLLDAHGATLAADIFAGERLVLKAGSPIRSTQIGLAASIGLNHLPTMPHPRVVVLSAGDDLVEPGHQLATSEDEFETNSWMLTTAVKEAGANAFRVHMIPQNHEQLKEVIEDQLVRADLIVISGESQDESFELITAVLRELGEISTVRPKMSDTGLVAFGLIGPDKTPVITLPGDPVVAYIASEILVRPMIRTMLGAKNIVRNKAKVKLLNDAPSKVGERAFIRVLLSNSGGASATVLPDQNDLTSLSDANGLVIVPEDSPGFKAGEQVDVLIFGTELLTMSNWPIIIKDGELILRPLRFRDRQVWDSVRSINNEWLSPWEATRPEIERDYPLPTYYQMVRQHRKDARGLRSLSFALWIKQGRKEVFVGQITMGGIVLGAQRGAHIGYWIDQRFASKGLTTRAVNALTKYGFDELLLHRIEINLRPENEASKRVAEKAGYYFEGSRLRYLHIDGAWRDHITFVKENSQVR